MRLSAVPIRYLWYILCGGIGAGMGISVNTLVASRLSPPTPGSSEDQHALEQLAQGWDKLDAIVSLRSKGYNLHSDTSLSGSGPGKGGWLELDLRRHIAEDTNVAEKPTRTLTEDTLTGIRGLGIQRAFWNSETREIVAVVWIGTMLSGWPGIAHGGVIATIFEDVMSRMMAGPHGSVDSVSTPSSMSVDYLRPTFSGNTFILRASFSKPALSEEARPREPEPKSWLPSWKDFTKKPSGASTVEINGTLEDLDGKVKVRAKCAWPASAVVNRG
ncbi:hypothetical protein BU24DRAFT_344714 [Aaosphaeria arxii CBS 175.79]|uniref:Thioesterase domain-containing protein n=1 Tax=Aaosphaeria arxii CBS 175.79 TaxID=1450172 RepID=A0A6A5XVF1_9PLEO|nr:uncharacterized protein BU24DRAFT_344714 [Aaosphaeria arxii CBS 175.79]KAF2017295.1 hypothetical protein BU24DRAFT_344714 [Aaosphaeria arxii CBS 175.79]